MLFEYCYTSACVYRGTEGGLFLFISSIFTCSHELLRYAHKILKLSTRDSMLSTRDSKLSRQDSMLCGQNSSWTKPLPLVHVFNKKV